MTERLYKIVISRDPDDGRFIAEVPTLAPCLTWGETLEEALEMAKEAIEGVLESREANGYIIEDDTEELVQESKRSALHTVLPIHFTPIQTRLSA
ncbi:type II toxin-antitoxin system HicB family antitoxin [Spirosoma montaniterrae]|uniref:type II toxin-antitoxin system HicB family antitoxin n=1 Tax=Spirosoma montaniterrae TaxID=1178516 RepID=UPI00097D387D|nr:type II toxin-antitoxin system HicB family antitoxin [Spirosoma montaniterrae]